MLHGHEPDRSPFDGLPAEGSGGNSGLQGGGGIESTQLLVSLFLILLTFFIVMNSISNQTVGKAGRVVESVNVAFKGGDKPYHPGVEGIDLLATAARDVHHDLFYEQGKNTLLALIDFPGEFAASGGNVMQVELRTSVLFGSGDAHLREDQTRFLNALADLLKKELAQEERTVEIMFAVRPAAFGKERAAAKLGIKRASSLARELEDRGVPGRSITTGIVPDKRDIMWLTLTSRSHAVQERDRKGAPAE